MLRVMTGGLHGFMQFCGMAKLTADIVRDIRSSSLPSIELARKYCIADTTVCDIKKFRTWKHVT